MIGLDAVSAAPFHQLKLAGASPRQLKVLKAGWISSRILITSSQRRAGSVLPDHERSRRAPERMAGGAGCPDRSERARMPFRAVATERPGLRAAPCAHGAVVAGRQNTPGPRAGQTGLEAGTRAQHRPRLPHPEAREAEHHRPRAGPNVGNSGLRRPSTQKMRKKPLRELKLSNFEC